METIFLVCAVVGGTVMLCQFAMTLLGMGEDSSDFADADAASVGDADVGDFGDGDAGDVDIGDDVQSGDARWSDVADGEVGQVRTSWLFGVLSLRSIVAALAFFGMAGMASVSAGLGPVPSLGIAVGAGVAAMYGVFALMRAIYLLRSDGNINIRGAVGRRGTVYVPIPGCRSGAGKIHINLQSRTVEYQAMTEEEEKLSTGDRIVVVDELGPDTVEVERISAASNVAEEED